MLAVVRRLLAATALAIAGEIQAAGEPPAPMRGPRQEDRLAVIDGTLWAVGGISEQGISAVVERWDATTDTWSVRAPLPRPLHHVGAAAVGGILYAIGGLDDAFEGVDTMFAYDPAADAWTPR